MDVAPLAIPEVKLLTPRRFADDRGFFSETYNKRTLLEVGIDADFVQDNQSYSRRRGTVRGLHFQSPPFAQDKLVRVLRGRVFDVAVDIREGSPTYGQHVGAELSAETGAQLLVPIGFLHGFVTLEDDTEVAYKVSNYYSRECDKGVIWNDPDIGIDWQINPREAFLSSKDINLPRFRHFKSPFSFDQAA